MKKLKNENGAITIITLITILFMVSFLISSYILVANKVKTQKEIIEETKRIYEPNKTMEELYNLYFNKSNIVPIYTVEQLLDMGTGSKNVNINGKYYDFNNDENTIYVLMNDLKFKVSDYQDKIEDDYWIPIGDRIIAYQEVLNNGLTEQDEQYFKAKFEGNNNKIEVGYVDKESDEYFVTYSQSSNYEEPEYEVNVIPRLSNAIIANEAKILKDDEETGVIGEGVIKIQRLNSTKVSAYLDDNHTTPKKTILIDNPNKLQNIELNIESIEVILTIVPTPSEAKVIINGQERNTITVNKGTTVNYTVSCDEYYTRQGNIIVDRTTTLPIELSPWNYIPFSEQFYFTRCSDETYNGLLNGGEATVEEYSFSGTDYSMGDFYIDESDIIQKIPSKAIVSKVTLHFEYYQSRDNTFLYTNRIKTSIFTGETEKMSEQKTERTNTTVNTATYELNNISRTDLEEGLVVKLINYIEGTLRIHSTVKNMYCTIEGEQPAL